MALADDIEDDYTYFDGVETVTYTPQNPAGTPQSSAKGLQRTASRNQFYATIFAPDDIATRWHVWASTLTNGSVIKVGDKITGSDSSVWVVRLSSYSPQTRRWICDCILEVS